MDSNSVAIVVFVGVELLLLAFVGWWVFRIFCPINPDKTPKNFGAALRNIPFWCWWVVALGGLQVCTIGLHIPLPIPNIAFLASLPCQSSGLLRYPRCVPCSRQAGKKTKPE